MKRFAIALAMSLTACCPTLQGPASDAGSRAWKGSPTEGTGQVIDCNGGKRWRLDIRSSHVTVRNCTILGDIRVWGKARNGEDPGLRDSSRSADHVSRARASAPTGVTIEDSRIIASHGIPLYIGPGSTFTTVRNVTIEGRSASVMVYLGAESHGTIINNVTIDAREAGREAIAIDASDRNVIRKSVIKHSKGGIFLYRNCGEGGTIRHTTPSDNVIESNTFSGDGVAVWLGSREGDRCYCQEDAGHPYGSSVSDMDHARRNTVRGNRLGGGTIRQGKTATGNVIKDNH